MSQLLQALYCLLRHALFHTNHHIHPLSTRPDTHPRRIQRLLRAQPSNDLPQQRLHVSLRLHEPAHDTKHAMQRVVAHVGDETGDDSMVGPLAGRVDVRVVLRVEREVGPAVLQREAAPLGDDTRAEAAVVGVDEGDGVALGVRHGEVDRVAALQRRAAVPHVPGRGPRRVEELGPLGEVRRGDELRGGHLHGVGVRDEPAGVGEGEPQGLDDGVQLLDDAQRHQRHDALPVGRVLPQLDARAVAALRRAVLGVPVGLPLDPLLPAAEPLARELQRYGLYGLASQLKMVRQVVQLQVPAQILHHLDQLRRDAARVEALLPLRSQRPERRGQGRILHDLARPRRAEPIAHARLRLEHLVEVRARLADQPLAAAPRVGRELADGEPLLAEPDGRREDLLHADPAAAEPLHRPRSLRICASVHLAPDRPEPLSAETLDVAAS
ncbi:hypothetical protein VP1G_11459 [Cytospora mali]|uniref:Uncharacterized protein n=1 Tax=Cytospora mali TaxID=578113 RepID=A0A194VGB2_CYTMA|nr:hypothetical protein VP1G_11459 [Valsa mali var. pyri (nom. inval.)]